MKTFGVILAAGDSTRFDAEVNKLFYKVNGKELVLYPVETFLDNTEIDEVLGDQVVEGLRMKNKQTQETEEIAITGLFIAIGHKPNTEIFKGHLDMDEAGYLITQGKTTKTNLPGVFASGDVQDKEYRQAVTAAGTGCMAALDAERYLQEIES